MESETTAGRALEHRGGEEVSGGVRIFRTRKGFDGRLPLGFPRSDPPVTNTDQKTRGGFYTSEETAGLVLERVSILVGHPADRLEVLEPSAGNGAFLPALHRVFGNRIRRVTAIEILETEASECGGVAVRTGIPTEVISADFLQWRMGRPERFDVAVGNPPFVRSHSLDESTKRHMRMLHAALGLSYSRMANLWIGVILGALSSIRVGGAFGFVVPSELITGVGAQSVRDWLAVNAEHLRIEILSQGQFPGVLQDVIVISGKHRPGMGGAITVSDQATGDIWTHPIRLGMPTWGPCLLSAGETAALDSARGLVPTSPMGAVARFEIGVITGANRFFLADHPTVEKHDLDPWAVQLLYQLRHTPGLVHTSEDHVAIREAGRRCVLLDFSAERPDPMDHPRVRDYILSGEHLGLHGRYKTRNRYPWYRAPHIKPGQLILPRNSYWHPRMIVNAARSVTTNAILRGWVRQPGLSPEDLTAGFHNSLTLLTAEMEGRTAGGGALDLLPSQVTRLAVPTITGLGAHLPSLDRTARTGGGDLVADTNALLSDIGKVPLDMWGKLESARKRLQQRRLAGQPVGKALDVLCEDAV